MVYKVTLKTTVFVDADSPEEAEECAMNGEYIVKGSAPEAVESSDMEEAEVFFYGN